jgi:hypothetical protein
MAWLMQKYPKAIFFVILLFCLILVLAGIGLGVVFFSPSAA